MKDLILVNENMVGDQEVNSVDARALHEGLESKRRFANWVQTKVLNNRFFEDGKDYTLFDNVVNNPAGGRPQVNYILTLETAKRVAMAEQTPKGEEVGTYFIKCEAKAHSIEAPQVHEVFDLETQKTMQASA